MLFRSRDSFDCWDEAVCAKLYGAGYATILQSLDRAKVQTGTALGQANMKGGSRWRERAGKEKPPKNRSFPGYKQRQRLLRIELVPKRRLELPLGNPN